MGNEQTPSSNRTAIIVGAVLAGIVAVFLIVGAIVNGIQQRADDERIDNMVNDRLNSCFDAGDC